MKKVLILGADSFTGSHCKENLTLFETKTTSRQEETGDFFFDCLNDDISTILKNKNYDALINCISMGDVDQCEENKSLAKKINYEFVKDLVKKVPKCTKLIHLSSNAVFDGNKSPYTEMDEKWPINYYGKLKNDADNYIVRHSSNFCILRPITMFGYRLKHQRHNPFSFFFEKLSKNDEIVAVNDVYVNMLNVDYLIQSIEVVISKNLTGEFNISGNDNVNRYEFVNLLKKLMSSESQIISKSSDEFTSFAKRPKDTSFDNTKMKKELGIYPNSLEIDLRKLINVTNISS